MLVGGVVTVAAMAALAWSLFLTETVSIPLVGDMRLSYRVGWGTGMSERFRLDRQSEPGPSAQGEWIAILEKPYNSGMAVYRTNDARTYYFAFSSGFYKFETSTAGLRYFCEPDGVQRTELGSQLFELGTSDAARNIIDPGAPNLQAFIDPSMDYDDRSRVVASKYYEGLQYLGRFGLSAGRSDVRGGKPGFVASADSREPRAALEGNCKYSDMVFGKGPFSTR